GQDAARLRGAGGRGGALWRAGPRRGAPASGPPRLRAVRTGGGQPRRREDAAGGGIDAGPRPRRGRALRGDGRHRGARHHFHRHARRAGGARARAAAHGGADSARLRGGSMIDTTRHLMDITERPALVFVRGAGSWLNDHTGKRYLDFVQGWAVNSLGHCPPVISEALAAQARTLITPSPAFYNEPALRLAATLAAHSDFPRMFFANSGAEANEGAIKLARKWGRREKDGAYEIITFDGAFHGRTLATMSASGKPGWDTMFAPQVPGFPRATFNDLASVEALIGPRTVAVMLEPVQGESGVVPATVEFLRALRALTQRHHCLMI